MIGSPLPSRIVGVGTLRIVTVKVKFRTLQTSVFYTRMVSEDKSNFNQALKQAELISLATLKSFKNS